MYTRPRVILTIMVLGALAGAGPLACKGKAPAGSHIQFKSEAFEKGYQGCKPKTPGCSHVQMEYPVFTGGTGSQALARLNQQVKKFLTRPLYEDKPQSPEQLAQRLFSEYEDLHKKFPEAPGGWFVERTIQAKQISPQILVLDFSDYTFAGGAHPNSFGQYLNLNPQTGAVYDLNQLLKPDSGIPLTRVAEEIFRKQQDLGPQENLGEAGYFFKDDQFALNNNFLITKEGLTFLFNAYEVAPYVMGPIEIQIPYGAIKDLINPQGPLVSLLPK